LGVFEAQYPAHLSPVYASLRASQRLVQNSGPSRSLILSRETLTFSTPCRFIPAHRTCTSKLSIMLGTQRKGVPTCFGPPFLLTRLSGFSRRRWYLAMNFLSC